MLRRLLILFALLLAPALAHARGIEPQLVAEGPAPPGGEVELAIHMRPAPGWHGYWLNPGDAGLPMDVKWQLPKGFSAGPLRYPVPTRLEIAGLMNYVYERDYAVLVRLKVPADARGTIPDPRRGPLARLHRQDLRSRAGRIRARPAGRHRNARARQVRRMAAAASAAAGHTCGVPVVRRQVSGSRSRCRAASPSTTLMFSRSTTGSSNMPRRRNSSATATARSPHLKSKPGDPRELRGVLALGDGRGLEFRAVRRPVGSSGTPLGEARRARCSGPSSERSSAASSST